MLTMTFLAKHIYSLFGGFHFVILFVDNKNKMFGPNKAEYWQ